MGSLENPIESENRSKEETTDITSNSSDILEILLYVLIIFGFVGVIIAIELLR